VRECEFVCKCVGGYARARVEVFVFFVCRSQRMSSESQFSQTHCTGMWFVGRVTDKTDDYIKGESRWARDGRVGRLMQGARERSVGGRMQRARERRVGVSKVSLPPTLLSLALCMHVG